MRSMSPRFQTALKFVPVMLSMQVGENASNGSVQESVAPMLRVTPGIPTETNMLPPLTPL